MYCGLLGDEGGGEERRGMGRRDERGIKDNSPHEYSGKGDEMAEQMSLVAQNVRIGASAGETDSVTCTLRTLYIVLCACASYLLQIGDKVSHVVHKALWNCSHLCWCLHDRTHSAPRYIHVHVHVHDIQLGDMERQTCDRVGYTSFQRGAKLFCPPAPCFPETNPARCHFISMLVQWNF